MSFLFLADLFFRSILLSRSLSDMDHGDIRKLSSFIVAEQSSSHESSVETEASLGCPLCLGAPGEIQVSDQDGGVVPEEVDHRSCRFCAVWATEGDRLARLLFALLGFRGQVFCSGSPSAGDSVPAQCADGRRLRRSWCLVAAGGGFSSCRTGQVWRRGLGNWVTVVRAPIG